jgi:hypothetical protein
MKTLTTCERNMAFRENDEEHEGTQAKRVKPRVLYSWSVLGRVHLSARTLAANILVSISDTFFSLFKKK